jgi:hypothetical protein
MVTGAGFAFVRGLMIFSLFSAVFNLAPFEFGASKTDGRRLWDALWRYIGSFGVTCHAVFPLDH